MKLGRLAEAEETFKALLEQNPDCHAYYFGYLKAKGLDLSAPPINPWLSLTSDTTLDEAQRAQVEEVLIELSQRYPKSSAPRRLRLDVLQGQSSPCSVHAQLIKQGMLLSMLRERTLSLVWNAVSLHCLWTSKACSRTGASFKLSVHWLRT